MRASPGRLHAVAAARGDHRGARPAPRTGSQVERARALPVRAVPGRPAGGHLVGSASARAAQLERTGRRRTRAATATFAERWEQAAERARPLMLEPPDRERWLEAVGPGILDGSIADELAGIPSEEVRVPFALQGLIGTLAGPDDPGTAFVGFYHDLGEAAGSPGAWGFARGGMGAVTGALRSAAEAAGAQVRAEAPSGAVLEDGGRRGRARGRRARSRRARCSRTPTPAHRAARRRRPAGRLAPGGPGGEGDAAARRAARLPGAGRARSRGRARSTSASRSTTCRPRPTTRAPGGPPRGRGSRPPARPRPTRRWRRQGKHVLSLFCQCFPRRRRRRGRGRRRDRALRRGLPGAARPHRRAARARPARARGALRHHRRPHLPRRDAARAAARGASRAGAASAASRASTWPARAPTPAAR